MMGMVRLKGSLKLTDLGKNTWLNYITVVFNELRIKK